MYHDPQPYPQPSPLRTLDATQLAVVQARVDQLEQALADTFAALSDETLAVLAAHSIFPAALVAVAPLELLHLCTVSWIGRELQRRGRERAGLPADGDESEAL